MFGTGACADASSNEYDNINIGGLFASSDENVAMAACSAYCLGISPTTSLTSINVDVTTMGLNAYRCYCNYDDNMTPLLPSGAASTTNNAGVGAVTNLKTNGKANWRCFKNEVSNFLLRQYFICYKTK